MDRLLTLKLDVLGCEAEAWLNGVPLARAGAARPRAVLPVHEYTLGGHNRLELEVFPPPLDAAEPEPPKPLTADGQQAAHLRILLPRTGHAIDEAGARTLAQLDWAPAAGEAFQAPLRLALDVNLPISFPRWRWLDAPPCEPTAELRQQALELLGRLAQDLAAGQFDAWLAATRLRSEELAAAYQRDAITEQSRLREHLARLYAEGRLKWQALGEKDLLLRRIAGGRLLECLAPDGTPALRTQPDETGQTLALPLRLAAVDGRLYVLR